MSTTNDPGLTKSQLDDCRYHARSLSAEAKADIIAGRWDEVMTDALYAACGAITAVDMVEARECAVRTLTAWDVSGD